MIDSVWKVHCLVKNKETTFEQFLILFLIDMRRHWNIRQTMFDQVESNLTTILGGKDYIQTHTLSPYFHEIGEL